jgi:hypothetical protein
MIQLLLWPVNTVVNNSVENDLTSRFAGAMVCPQRRIRLCRATPIVAWIESIVSCDPFIEPADTVFRTKQVWGASGDCEHFRRRL